MALMRTFWFRRNRGGGFPVPATSRGWAVVALFVAATLGSAWLPDSIATQFRIACGLAFVIACMCLTDWSANS